MQRPSRWRRLLMSGQTALTTGSYMIRSYHVRGSPWPLQCFHWHNESAFVWNKHLYPIKMRSARVRSYSQRSNVRLRKARAGRTLAPRPLSASTFSTTLLSLNFLIYKMEINRPCCHRAVAGIQEGMQVEVWQRKRKYSPTLYVTITVSFPQPRISFQCCQRPSLLWGGNSRLQNIKGAEPLASRKPTAAVGTVQSSVGQHQTRSPRAVSAKNN